MEKQRERARAGHKFSGDKSSGTDKAKLIYKPARPNFVGYDKLKTSSKVSYILDQESGQSVESAKKGQKVAVVLEATPFYGEVGGDYRLDIARNHTATHLLQAALRQVLGSHVQQRGSMVHPEGFRFDFAHLTAINKQQLDDIQHFVNERIRENLPVKSKVVPYKQAIADGAIALFEEKYGDTVRELEIGGPRISAELCGGTHVKSTGEIGLFLITSESSIGTGLRRIEAVTGRGAERFINERLSILSSSAHILKTLITDLPDRVKNLTVNLSARE